MRAKPYVFHSLSACAGCGCSGDDFPAVSVEAFEATGELYCEECADAAIVAARSDERPQPSPHQPGGVKP